MKNVYWDSNVIMAAFKEREDNHQIAKDGILQAEAGNLTIYVSYFSMVETRFFDNKNLQSHDDINIVEKFFNNPYIRPAEISELVKNIAVDLTKTYHKPKNTEDLLHVASAMFLLVHAKIDDLILETFDKGRILGNTSISHKYKGKEYELRLQEPNYHPELPLTYANT